MDEISFEDIFGDENKDMAAMILEAITEKSRNDGLQIGVPWSKPVYDYLFESEAASDIEGLMEIFSLVPEQIGTF